MAFKKHVCQRCNCDLSHRHHSAKYCARCREIKTVESTRRARAGRDNIIHVGFLGVNNNKSYSCGYEWDEKGRCNKVKISAETFDELGVTVGRHPSIARVERFMNTEEGKRLLIEKSVLSVIDIWHKGKLVDTLVKEDYEGKT